MESKKDTNEFIYKTGTDSDREDKQGYQKQGDWRKEKLGVWD